MDRVFAGTLLASVIAVGLGACDGGSDHEGHRRGRGDDACRQFATCDTCTPVNGCGWCFNGNGSGSCASDPDECVTEPTFSWTWEPTGCRTPADASVVPSDAGAVLTDSGDATGDALTCHVSDGSPSDAGCGD